VLHVADHLGIDQFPLMAISAGGGYGVALAATAPTRIARLVLVSAQAAPYDMFFGCIEQCLHEHGALAPAALLAELRAKAEREAEGAAVIARIAAFHDPLPDADMVTELALVLDRLRLQAVEDELKLLFETPSLSPDAQARGKALMGTQARLKAQLAQRQSADRRG